LDAVVRGQSEESGDRGRVRIGGDNAELASHGVGESRVVVGGIVWWLGNAGGSIGGGIEAEELAIDDGITTDKTEEIVGGVGACDEAGDDESQIIFHLDQFGKDSMLGFWC